MSRLGWLLLLASGAALAAGDATLDPQREVAPFVREVTARSSRLDPGEVRRILEQARVLPEVLERIARPAEAMPWYRYRRIFLTEERIAGGVRFAAEQREVLERAHRRFGVEPAVVSAIIGVETFYGRHHGHLRVLDSLATLAFRYPRRGAFFRAELEQFLLLAGEEAVDPLATLGSYAGAMGLPQFIPSSYRRYAVDFDGDGRRDLLASTADAVGSVANYLAEHGWRDGEPVAFPARVEGEGYRELLAAGLRPGTALARFADYGVRVEGGEDDGGAWRAALLELEGEDGPRYWAVLGNFYVITRYNRSPLYAMAVHQLAAALRARIGSQGEPR